MRLIATLALMVLLGLPAVSFADPDEPEVFGTARPGALGIEGVADEDGSIATPSAANPPKAPEWVPTGPTLALGTAPCEGAPAVGALGPVIAEFCLAEGDDPEPALTIGAVRRAFEEWRLPAGELVIEPPGGATLVNLDTNFFTTSTESLQRTVTLLGQQVTLEATPDVYTWSFGDGEALTTSDPGAAYPSLRISHRYLKVDTYRPSLGTTYVGRFRVGGGPWRQIPGTVTVDGASQDLRAVEATPKLVGR